MVWRARADSVAPRPGTWASITPRWEAGRGSGRPWIQSRAIGPWWQGHTELAQRAETLAHARHFLVEALSVNSPQQLDFPADFSSCRFAQAFCREDAPEWRMNKGSVVSESSVSAAQSRRMDGQSHTVPVVRRRGTRPMHGLVARYNERRGRATWHCPYNAASHSQPYCRTPGGPVPAALGGPFPADGRDGFWESGSCLLQLAS